MAFKRLRQALDRSMAVVSVTTDGALYEQTSDSTTAAALLTSPVDASGVAFGTSGNPLYTALTAGSALVGTVAIDQTTPGTTNGVVATGNVAAGATDSGNPLKTGGKNNTTKPTLTDGQRGDTQLDTRGNTQVSIWGANSNTGAAVYAGVGDGASDATVRLFTQSWGGVFDSSTGWDNTRRAITGTNSTGTGITAAAMVAQFDDSSIQAMTENRFGNVRMAASHALITKPFESEANCWGYAAAASGIVNTTTAVTFKAADATLRNYVTGIDIMSEALTNATELAIRDGAGGTVLWRTKIGTGGLINGRNITFNPPLKGTAATLLEVVTLTASGAGAVYFNATGYVGV